MLHMSIPGRFLSLLITAFLPVLHLPPPLSMDIEAEAGEKTPHEECPS